MLQLAAGMASKNACATVKAAATSSGADRFIGMMADSAGASQKQHGAGMRRAMIMASWPAPLVMLM